MAWGLVPPAGPLAKTAGVLPVAAVDLTGRRGRFGLPGVAGGGAHVSRGAPSLLSPLVFAPLASTGRRASHAPLFFFFFGVSPTRLRREWLTAATWLGTPLKKTNLPLSPGALVSAAIAPAPPPSTPGGASGHPPPSLLGRPPRSRPPHPPHAVTPLPNGSAPRSPCSPPHLSRPPDGGLLLPSPVAWRGGPCAATTAASWGCGQRAPTAAGGGSRGIGIVVDGGGGGVGRASPLPPGAPPTCCWRGSWPQHLRAIPGHSRRGVAALATPYAQWRTRSGHSGGWVGGGAAAAPPPAPRPHPPRP